MSTLIGSTIAAGNAAYATVYQMPAGSRGYITALFANNSTGGSLDASIAVTRQNGTQYVLDNARAVAANATQYYSGGSAVCLTPLVLLPGEVLQGKGSGAGVNVTFSGKIYDI